MRIIASWRNVARCVRMSLFAAVLLGTNSAAQGWHHLGKIRKVQKLTDGVELSDGTAKVRITAFTDGVFRVRLAPNGTFPKDFSWAVIESPQPPNVKIEEDRNGIRVTTGKAIAVVQKSSLLISFSDPSGNVLLADEPSLPMAWDGQRVHAWKKMLPEEGYYGLGDKAGPMNRRNRAFTNWNTDAYGWQESTDPLYKTIPFFIGLNKGVAYGVFFDNTYWSSFDFGKESRDYLSFGAEGGELNYYFIAGPAPKTVVERFTELTGRPPLPPLWTLGYQQCRYSYYPEARVREIAATLREKNIPADTIYLDIDYQEGYAPFTINRQYFPHFEEMIADLRKQGFHIILITDLHIKKNPDHGYAPYDSGMRDDVFVKNPDGLVYVGVVWPGESVFPDFTLTRVRDWWGNLYKDFVRMGVSGFWNDMNEPAVFRPPEKTMPLSVVHRLDDGTSLDHRAVHNVYGMQNARATYDGLRKLQPDERPFVLTRAAYAGTQRFAATWTGDNSATWNHLSMSTPMLLSMGVSGYPMVGDDIGGFASSPPADLLTRWYEIGAFNPIYRNHAAKGTADHEPWASGPGHEAIRRKYIELRYKLLPYIYTVTEEEARTGIPLMRPVFLEYPGAEEFYGDDRDFFFGPDFFVAPVISETSDAEKVALPPGEWYDFWTLQKHSNKDQIDLHPKLDEVPLYARAGAIVPMQPLVQYTGQTPDGPLELHVYLPSKTTVGECRGELYQDDGHTFAYERGQVLRVSYGCQVSANQITVTSTIDKNGFRPWWDSAELEIFGMTSEPKEVRVDTNSLSAWHYDSRAQSLTLTLPNAVRNWTVRVGF
jgi:alpha-glucosidase